MSGGDQTFQDLVARWRAGDARAGDAIAQEVYGRLREIAGRYFRREPGRHTLQPTAILNDALVQLLNQPDPQWEDRRHFIAVAALAMRRALVDHARHKKQLKRGGAQWRVTLDDAAESARGPEPELIDLDRALEKLTKIDPRKAELVQLRYFAGLSIEEAATQLGVSVATANRDWRLAKAWLYRALNDG